MSNYQPYFNTGALITKYLRNELTAQEKDELDQWLKSDPRNPELFNRLLDDTSTGEEMEIFSAAEKQLAWENIVKKIAEKKSAGPTKMRRLLSYAAVFLLFIAGVFVTRYFIKKDVPVSLVHHNQDILPGANKAILTLSNGSKVVLSDVKGGTIAHQRDVAIDIKNGRVVYQIDGTGTRPEEPDFTKAILLNTLTTPRGGQYQLELPDGTRVWLNSSSSLTYPVTFTGKERRVELTGEAYFEVAKNAESPFFVKTSGQTIKVLGTHFNINSYQDEKSVKTTLLEGSVVITGNGNKQIANLKPGQQSVNRAGNLDIVNDVDIDEAIAWKNGKFLFKNTDLQSVMRQLSRWYDVDIEFKGAVAVRHYRGRISRNVPVSQVFEILKTSGVNFIINGRTIIVKS